jgi:hypothetical protein
MDTFNKAICSFYSEHHSLNVVLVAENTDGHVHPWHDK